MRLEPAEWAVLVFTGLYVAIFVIYFLAIGNHEFIWYVLTLMGLCGLIVVTRKRAALPPALLWALSFWGLAHMAGGSVRVGEGVLYNYVVWPLADQANITVFKYDQLVHFYGFAVAAVVLWHLLYRHFENLRGTATIYVYPVLGSMGLGAVNEMIEFAAVLLFPDTNVGGYFNTALDLVFNGLGAITAMAAVLVFHKLRRGRTVP